MLYTVIRSQYNEAIMILVSIYRCGTWPTIRWNQICCVIIVSNGEILLNDNPHLDKTCNTSLEGRDCLGKIHHLSHSAYLPEDTVWCAMSG